jgi:Tfp pilus assembly protein PilV
MKPMKFSSAKFTENRTRHTARLGFTLGEMMVTVGIFSIVVLAMLFVQIFGLRVYQLSSTKLIATTEGRQVMDKIRDPIRSANTVAVGFYTNSFTPIPSGSQIGNAILISLLTNSVVTNNYIIFYQFAASNQLCCVTSSNNVPTVVANYVTNNLCFQTEDCFGNVLSSPNQNNPVIRVDLGFIQLEFTGGNSVSAYDFYHLQTRITPRIKK